MAKSVRKITMPVTKPIVKKPAPVAVPPKPVPAVLVQPPARIAKPKSERVVHAVTSLYSGPSAGLNKRKSRTVLDLSEFNTKPDYILRERSELVAETIKRQYGDKPFVRANFDAGILKFLLWKGHVEAVSGNGDENTVMRFTKTGMAHRRSV